MAPEEVEEHEEGGEEVVDEIDAKKWKQKRAQKEKEWSECETAIKYMKNGNKKKTGDKYRAILQRECWLCRHLFWKIKKTSQELEAKKMQTKKEE